MKASVKALLSKWLLLRRRGGLQAVKADAGAAREGAVLLDAWDGAVPDEVDVVSEAVLAERLALAAGLGAAPVQAGGLALGAVDVEANGAHLVDARHLDLLAGLAGARARRLDVRLLALRLEEAADLGVVFVDAGLLSAEHGEGGHGFDHAVDDSGRGCLAVYDGKHGAHQPLAVADEAVIQ